MAGCPVMMPSARASASSVRGAALIACCSRQDLIERASSREGVGAAVWRGGCYASRCCCPKMHGARRIAYPGARAVASVVLPEPDSPATTSSCGAVGCTFEAQVVEHNMLAEGDRRGTHRLKHSGEGRAAITNRPIPAISQSSAREELRIGLRSPASPLSYNPTYRTLR